MRKLHALKLLNDGKTPATFSAAARRVGVSRQAVSLWPDPLTPAIRDRVQAALWRAMQGIEDEASPSPASKGVAGDFAPASAAA